MRLSRARMLDRFQASDATYDGRFITGVFTTGIYCLPSCSARKPKPENVGFFPSPSEARAAGLRPCRRCHPDDFVAGRDPEQELARDLVETLTREPEAFAAAADLGERFGLGRTRLHSLLRRQYHATPSDLLTQSRLEATQRRLTSTRERVLDIALDVGFESLSTFNEAFGRRLGMTPSAYRGLPGTSRFELRLPRTLDRRLTLAYLGRDPENPTQQVDGSTVRLGLVLGGEPGALEIELGPGRADCRLHGAGRQHPEAAVRAFRVAHRVLGLITDPRPFESHVRRHRSEHLPLIEPHRGLRIPQTVDVFEGLVWSLVGQQVNLAFAFRLRRVIIELAGRRVDSELRTHPTASEVARLDYPDLTRRQFSRRKAEYVIDLARRIAEGALDLEALARQPVPVVESSLLAERGIGPWSAHYLMMRGLALADCLPAGDSGLAASTRAYFELDHRPGPEEITELLEPFRPYRSFATTHFWTRLGGFA